MRLSLTVGWSPCHEEVLATRCYWNAWRNNSVAVGAAMRQKRELAQCATAPSHQDSRARTCDSASARWTSSASTRANVVRGCSRRLEQKIADCLPNKRLAARAGLICPLRKAFPDSAVARRRAGDTRERNYVLSLVAEQRGHDGGRGQAEMVRDSQEDIQRIVRQLAAHRRVGAFGDRTERECWREAHHRQDVLLD